MQKSTMVVNGIERREPELDVSIEEADLRMMVHIKNAAQNGIKRSVVVSNDTDVLVLLMNYWATFKEIGLEELWMRGGAGDTTRYIPVHSLAEKVGPEICKCIIGMHMLTGTDVTSKFGTKASALKAKPEMYLADFGNDIDSIDIDRAEEYLVQVYKPGTHIKTLDALRFFIYHQSKKSLVQLPSTSYMARSHILRAFLGAFTQLHCFSGLTLNPEEYGYEMQDGLLLPVHDLRLLPPDFPSACKCGKCATLRCKCRLAGISCCTYCKCKAAAIPLCKNPNVLLQIPMRM